jgi:hypothetical protein
LHPTPLCGPKIGAVLEARFSPTVLPIYHGGAGEAQAVRSLWCLAQSNDLSDCSLALLSQPAILAHKKGVLMRRYRILLYILDLITI